MRNRLPFDSNENRTLETLESQLDEIGYQAFNIQLNNPFDLAMDNGGQIHNFLTLYLIDNRERIYPRESLNLRYFLIDVFKTAIINDQCKVRIKWDKYEKRTETPLYLPIEIDYLDEYLNTDIPNTNRRVHEPDQMNKEAFSIYDITFTLPSELRSQADLQTLGRPRNKIEDQFWMWRPNYPERKIEGLRRQLVSYKEFNTLHRNLKIADERIRTALQLPVDHNIAFETDPPLHLSDYYKAHRLIRFVAYCQKLRNVLLGWFTDEILLKIVELNELNTEIVLAYEGTSYEDTQLTSWLDRVLTGELSYVDLFNEVYK